MSLPRPWLPLDCLHSTRAAHSVVHAVTDWSKNWFAKDGWLPETCFSPVEGDDWTELSSDDQVTVSVRAKAMLDLALAILSTKAPRTPPSQHDLRFLRRLAARATEDLSARVADALPALATKGDHAITGNQWRLNIGPPNQPALAISIDETDLIGLARKAYRPLAPASSLASRAEPLKDMPLKIAGVVGNTRLAVEQIKSLEIGDILVLDQKSDEPVRLVVDGCMTDLPLRVGQEDGRLTLSLQD